MNSLGDDEQKEVCLPKKQPMSRSQKKRFNWFKRNGYTKEEALKMSLEPIDNLVDTGEPDHLTALRQFFYRPKCWNKGFKVGIFSDTYPNDGFSEEHFLAIQKEINLFILNKSKTCHPQFYGKIYNPGWLELICANEETAKWILEITPELKPWEGAKIKALEEKDFPSQKTVVVYLPPTKASDHMIISYLQKQNSDTLKEGTWKMVKRNNSPRQTKIFLRIDQEYITALNADNYFFYDLFTVRFRIKDGERTKRERRNANLTGSAESQTGSPRDDTECETNP